jgi:hypothetical protein
MPRIFWEEALDVNLLPQQREVVLLELTKVVAEAINYYDGSPPLNPSLHIEVDIIDRHSHAWMQQAITVTVRGRRKPARVANSDAIGDAIWERTDPLIRALDYGWSLSLCWDEHYYRDSGFAGGPEVLDPSLDEIEDNGGSGAPAGESEG